MQNDATGISGSREHKIVYLLCLLAALHVLIFSAAFPFFNNVDEEYHFDMVVKYAQGRVPTAFEPVSVEAAHYIALYRSREYFSRESFFQSQHVLPPQWTWPASDEKLQQALLYLQTKWQNQINYESSQPPLYYGLAGLWWDICKGFGFTGGELLYLLRFFNAVFVALLVWTGYLTAGEIFGEKIFLKMGVPALLAFLPQTAFYSINSDVLSPLCFGISLIYLTRWARTEVPCWRTGTAAGLALAATLLVKMSNLPLIAVGFGAALWKIWRMTKSGKLSSSWATIVCLFGSALLPIAIWMMWCKIHFGDLTGSGPKISYLGWTLKPFSEWWAHPIFTPSGLWLFTFRSVSTFWRGEFVWHLSPLYFLPSDLLYVLLSIGLIPAVIQALFSRSRPGVPFQRQMIGILLVCILSEFFFFAFLSIIYDFHNCFYPSRAQPYFTSGRLMLGALIPFLLLFIYQLDRLLNQRSMITKFIMLGFFISIMSASEIITDWPVFSSHYNWYHMLGS